MVIRTKTELETYLNADYIEKENNDYDKYKVILSTWKQDESGEDSLKKRIKESSIWPVLKAILPVYQRVKLFAVTIKNLGMKRALSDFKRSISNLGCFRVSRGRKFLAKIIPTEEEQTQQRAESEKWEGCISILVPLYNTPERYLRDMIASVQGQTYGKWQLCLADGSDTGHSEVERICREYWEKDARIIYEKLEKNTGIAGNTNACIRMATGEYIAFFDHDDMLHPSALYECMKVIRETGADFIYTDELTFLKDNLNHIVTKHYKPDFSPDNLRGVNYICHLSVFKKSLLEKTGLLDDAYNGSQDHDILLKLTSVAGKVVHIPKILYFWRVHPGSVAMDIEAKEYAIEAGRNAVRDNEVRLGREAQVVSSKVCATHYRLTYKLVGRPLVSIIIIEKERAKTKRLLYGIYSKSTYENYEIVISDNLPKAVSKAVGDYFIFLSDDMEIVMGDWIQMLLMYVQREDVGIAAGRILTPNGIVREAGYITGLEKEKLVTPIGEDELYSDLGYMGRMYYANNVNACSLYSAMLKSEDAQKILEPELGRFSGGRYPGLILSKEIRLQKRNIVVNPYVIFIKEQEEIYSLEEQDLARNMVGNFPDPYYNTEVKHEK